MDNLKGRGCKENSDLEQNLQTKITVFLCAPYASTCP